MKQLIRKLLQFFLKDDVFLDIEHQRKLERAQEDLKIALERSETLTGTVIKREKSLEVLDIQLKESLSELQSCTLKTELDSFCEKKYKIIPNRKYAQKRVFKGHKVPVYVNELITPNSYSIEQYREQIGKGQSLYADTSLIAKHVGRDVRWTDDKTLHPSGEYYLYPNETLALGKGDCEDKSFILTSLNKEIGLAYGLWGKIGHAWNVILMDGELYCVETSDNKGTITRYEEGKPYTIHFIITPTRTYRVNDGPRFGEIATWKTKSRT